LIGKVAARRGRGDATMIGMRIALGVLVLAGWALTACTSSGPGAGTASPPGSATRPAPSTPAGSTPAAAPTTAAAARACPFIGSALVRNAMGMRLGRLTVLRSGGRTVGCRFYAIQGSPLHDSEHLPGPRQPVVEIRTELFATAAAAHNAFVRAAQAGRNPVQTPLGGGRIGVCYQAPFYPKDRGRDWACGVSVGTTRVLVRTVDTTGAFSTAAVTKEVLRHV
jgi:hypothetical protein